MKYLVFIHHFLYYLAIIVFLLSIYRSNWLGRALGYGLGDIFYYFIWLIMLLINTGFYVYDHYKPHWILKVIVILVALSVIIFIFLMTYVYYGVEFRFPKGKPKW